LGQVVELCYYLDCMGKIAEKFKINPDILRQCRKQMGLSLEIVQKKVKSIEEIETGKKRPTYKQLAELSDLYQVPDWVFISDNLPKEYQYEHKPSFRSFGDYKAFNNYKVRQLITRVEHYRNLFIELREDLDNPVEPFRRLKVSGNDMKSNAIKVREWLGMGIDDYLEFPDLRERVEDKGIFVFLTSKYNDWSHVDYDENSKHAFRGLAITDKITPIIIVNNSDSRKAQSFTLMHEFGHILRDYMDINDESSQNPEVERWCNRLAAEILMPEDSKHWPSVINEDLPEVERLARKFKVSTHACLVRLAELKKISQGACKGLMADLRKKQEEQKEKFSQNEGRPARNRSKEISEQFGSPFVKTVLTAWHGQEMTLTKVVRLFNLKRAQQVFDLEKYV